MHPAFTHRESHRRVRPLIALIALATLSALLVAGCSAGTSTSGTAAGSSAGAPGKDSAGVSNTPGAKVGALDAQTAPNGQAGTPEASKPGAPVPGVGPKLTKSASLSVQVKNIDAGAAQVRSIAAGLQAQVLNEQIGTGGPADPIPPGSASSPATDFGTLTLSVPSDKLDSALDQLSKIGTVKQRNLSTQDVTTQYVDTQSRLKTMRASVERVRALMAQAKDLGQVVALESELSRRQADLESLETQLAALTNSVERSTLSVSLTTPAHEQVTQAGFVAGLRSGWDAFTASARGLFTGLGAVVPFAVFFLLVAAPVIWWLRRRQTSQAAQVNT
jgi:hypothetical protein